MQIINNSSMPFFQLSQTQELFDLLKKEGIIDENGLVQEKEIESVEELICEPTERLLDLINKPQDVKYQKIEYGRENPFSLWEFYESMQYGHSSAFYIIGKSLFYLFGASALIAFLKKITLKKEKKSFWDLLPKELRSSLQKECNTLTPFIDICIHKQPKKGDSVDVYFKEGHSFLIQKLAPSTENFFSNFFSNEYGIVNENQSYTVQKILFGRHTILLRQFVEDPQVYRCIHEALRLKVNYEKEKITSMQLQAPTQLLLFQSLFDSVLKISRRRFNEVFSEEDLAIMLRDQTQFMVSLEEGQESALAVGLFTKTKIENTQKLKRIILSAYDKDFKNKFSALACLTLNALRICLPYIDETYLMETLEEEFRKFSVQLPKFNFMHGIMLMLRNKIGFEKLCACIQVVAFTALHHDVEIDRKKIVSTQHRKCTYLQIGIEHAFLLEWDIKKAVNIVKKHFGSVSVFLPNNLIKLFDVKFSAKEIIVFSSSKIKQLTLAIKVVPILPSAGREQKTNNPEFVSSEIQENLCLKEDQEDKLKNQINILNILENEKKDTLDISPKEEVSNLLSLLSQTTQEQTKLLLKLDQLCSSQTKSVNLPPEWVKHVIKEKQCYPNLFKSISFSKVQEIELEQFALLKKNSKKLHFFIQFIELQKEFNRPYGANWLEMPQYSSKIAKINTESSYISLMSQMYINKLSFEKIYATIEVLFFASSHENFSKQEPQECTHNFKYLQIGDEENFTLLFKINEAIQIVLQSFDLLSSYLFHPTLSAEELLFIAAHHAGEKNAALKMMRKRENTKSIAQRLVYNLKIPVDQKIEHLLLFLKNTPEHIGFVLEQLNSILNDCKRRVDLPEVALQCIEKDQKQYPHLTRFLKPKIKAPEKKSVDQKNIPKQTQEKEWLELMRKSKYKKALLVFKILIKNKPEKMLHQFLVQHDEVIGTLLDHISLEAFKKLDWQQFCFSFAKLKEIPQAMGRRLEQLAKEVKSEEDIHLLKWHFNPNECLFFAAVNLKENVELSKICFNLMRKIDNDLAVENKTPLDEVFGSYLKVEDLTWLIENLYFIESLFFKETDFKPLLEHVMGGLARIKSTYNYQDTDNCASAFSCISVLLKFNQWSPVLASSLSIFCRCLRERDGTFRVTKEEVRLKDLFLHVGSVEVLREFKVFCFDDFSTVLPHFFINCLIGLLNKNEQLRKTSAFLELYPTLHNHLKNELKEKFSQGVDKEKWVQFFKQAVFLFHHYAFSDLKTKAYEFFLIPLEVILFSALCENDLSFFNTLTRRYMLIRKGGGASEVIYLYAQILKRAYKLTKQSSSELIQLQTHVGMYEKGKQSNEIFFSFEGIQNFEKREIELNNWIVLWDKEEKLEACPVIYSRLANFYLEFGTIISELVGHKESKVQDCLSLANLLVFSQINLEAKRSFSFLPQILQAFFNRFKSIDQNLNVEDRAKLLKLILLNGVLNQKKWTQEELKWFNELTSKEVTNTCHRLVHEVLIMDSPFSIVVASEIVKEYFKKEKESDFKWIKLLKEDHLKGKWKENCLNPKEALEFVKKYFFLSYALSKENQPESHLIFKAGISLFKDFILKYSEYDKLENLQTLAHLRMHFDLFYSLKTQLQQLYVHLFQEKEVPENKNLSFEYHGFMFAFFRFFTSNILTLKCIGYKEEAYFQDFCQEVELFVRQKNALENEYWKKLYERFYELAKSLKSISEPKKKELCERFQDFEKYLN